MKYVIKRRARSVGFVLSKHALVVSALFFFVPAAKAVDAASPVPTGEQMVEAFHSAFGNRHVRATHAKGIMAVGSYSPSRDAAKLSKASVFAADSSLLLRFSDFTGIPDIADTAGPSNPRGLAIKFIGSSGPLMDVVTHNFNGFPTANAAEFRQLLLTLSASGADAPKPTPLDRFLDTHPIAKAFLTTQKKPSVSYASVTYFGVNAFKYTAADGSTVQVRYQFVPTAGEQFLTEEELAKAGPNYLSEELPVRLAKGPVTYQWYAQIADAGDAVDNPSVAWPDTRRRVDLGTITITRMATDKDAIDKETLFMPTNLPDGIEPTDPMLLVRQDAYPVSFGERQ
jgi:catalase